MAPSSYINAGPSVALGSVSAFVTQMVCGALEKINHMKLSVLSLLTITLAAAPALATDEEKRELGAHEHGHGVLNIAVEKNRISMELDAPGMDIVGFEHKPENDEQKATAQKAEALLREALVLFKVPAGAGCKVTEAKVALESEEEHDHDAGKKDAAAGKNDSTAKPAEKAGEKHEEHEGHNDYNATYVLECAKPASITSIQFDYFKSFAGAKALTVNVVTEKAQNTYEVTSEKPLLDLGGTM